ncbi:hypothetical protein [Vibrio alginolyticus]|uniref:hypothetical protein n=1 Tax=Vibrio alginolyticus TaxID=663 RepID=UPI0006CA8124|nr:hypothetical protein [Vibrio alginolyticus]KPM97501.1 hypothetical protein AOG25_13600 [Vibrio alginolyticus]
MPANRTEVNGKLAGSGLGCTLMLDENSRHLFMYIENILSSQVDLEHSGYFIESASDSSTRITILCKDRDTEFKFEIDDESAFAASKLLQVTICKVDASELPSNRVKNASFPIEMARSQESVSLRISNEIDSHMLVNLPGFSLIAHLDMFGVNLTPNLDETYTLSFTGNVNSQNGASTYAGISIPSNGCELLKNHLIEHRFIHLKKK